jgi:hypothetical protein
MYGNYYLDLKDYYCSQKKKKKKTSSLPLGSLDRALQIKLTKDWVTGENQFIPMCSKHTQEKLISEYVKGVAKPLN